MYFGNESGLFDFPMAHNFNFSLRALAHTSSENWSLLTLIPACSVPFGIKDFCGKAQKKTQVSSQLKMSLGWFPTQISGSFDFHCWTASSLTSADSPSRFANLI